MLTLIQQPTPYPRSFLHIGISVPDLDAAVKFYTEVLGWDLIMPPTENIKNDSAIGEMCTDVFGAGWEHFHVAHLSTGDRISVELYEFKNQENSEDNFEYWKTGIFHFCVQALNVEELAEKIVTAGGKKRMKAPYYYYPGEKPYRMIYMEDPFGNILEIYSHNYEQHYASAVQSNAPVLQDQKNKEQYHLSERKTQILELIHNEKTNREIAEKLCISQDTVKFHLRGLYQVLDVSGVSSRSEAVEKALQLGLLNHLYIMQDQIIALPYSSFSKQ